MCIRDRLRGPLAQLVEHRTFNPMVAGSIPARLIPMKPLLRRGFLRVWGSSCRRRRGRFRPGCTRKAHAWGVYGPVRSLLWLLKTAGRFQPLFDEVGYWLQRWGLPAPGDLPALCPQERLRAGGCAGTDLHAEAFAVTKELLGDAEAEDGVEVCLQGECGVPAGEAADPVVSGGLAPLTLTPLTLTSDASGKGDRTEAP